MAYKTCENCGCRVYKLGCVNCDEVRYIAEQYEELGMPVPDSILKEIAEKKGE